MNDADAPCPVLRVPPAGWRSLAAFILRHNRLPDGRPACLHAHQGDTLLQHEAELEALPTDEAAFWTCGEPAGTLGLIGCEFDAPLRRAWLRGPFTAEGGADDLARRLLQALECDLPDIVCFDAFPTETAEALNRLYAQAGYSRQAVHRVMQATLDASAIDRDGPGADPAAAAGVARAKREDLEAVLALHHALFPAGYLKDADFESALAARDRLLLACRVDGRLVGYLHAKDEPAQGEVYIDYVGVADEARGQGLGRGLLQSALRWGRRLGRPLACLTVREDRAPALSLYQRLGFRQVSAGVHWRKERVGAAPDGGS